MYNSSCPRFCPDSAQRKRFPQFWCGIQNLPQRISTKELHRTVLVYVAPSFYSAIYLRSNPTSPSFTSRPSCVPWILLLFLFKQRSSKMHIYTKKKRYNSPQKFQEIEERRGEYTTDWHYSWASLAQLNSNIKFLNIQPPQYLQEMCMLQTRQSHILRLPHNYKSPIPQVGLAFQQSSLQNRFYWTQMVART